MPLRVIAAVFFGLWIAGTGPNLWSMTGMAVVVGSIPEVVIFDFSEYGDLKGPRIEREAPVVAAILALMPLALAIGQASSRPWRSPSSPGRSRGGCW